MKVYEVSGLIPKPERPIELWNAVTGMKEHLEGELRETEEDTDDDGAGQPPDARHVVFKISPDYENGLSAYGNGAILDPTFAQFGFQSGYDKDSAHYFATKTQLVDGKGVSDPDWLGGQYEEHQAAWVDFARGWVPGSREFFQKDAAMKTLCNAVNAEAITSNSRLLFYCNHATFLQREQRFVDAVDRAFDGLRSELECVFDPGFRIHQYTDICQAHDGHGVDILRQALLQ